MGMIRVGDLVYFRTSVTHRKVAGEVIYINYAHGWCTVEVKTKLGKFREAVYIREMEGYVSKEQKKTIADPTTLWKDTYDDWLSEWDDDKIDAEVRRLDNERISKRRRDSDL